MHVFATPEEAKDLAEQIVAQPVVVRAERPKRPVKVKSSDGAQVEAVAIYSVERLGASHAKAEVAQTQVAPESQIHFEAIQKLIELQRRRRRAAAMLLL